MESFELNVDDEIALRLLNEQDTGELFCMVNKNRDYLREWLPWLDNNTKEEDSRNYIVDCIRKYTEKTALNLGVFFKNKLVGSVGFNVIQRNNNSAEIGYMLDEEFVGKGIVSKSCKQLIDYGFRELNLNRITIKCAKENERSISIAKRLDFKKEGIIKQNEWLYNRYVDHIHFGLLKEDWKNQ